MSRYHTAPMSDHQPTTHPESENHPEPTDSRANTRETWASLYTLLAEGLKHPDERLYRDVETGRFAAELARLTESLSVSLPGGPGSPNTTPDGRAAFDREYIALFEGLQVPYAPLVESVYRPWHEGTTSEGLLLGPPAAEMQSRYDAAGLSVPPAYQPDHLALLLEYAAALLRAGEQTAYLSFLDRHFDWLPALRQVTCLAAADIPFHNYCVIAVCETVAAARSRAELTPPSPDSIEEMIDRVTTRVE